MNANNEELQSRKKTTAMREHAELHLITREAVEVTWSYCTNTCLLGSQSPWIAYVSQELLSST